MVRSRHRPPIENELMALAALRRRATQQTRRLSMLEDGLLRLHSRMPLSPIRSPFYYADVYRPDERRTKASRDQSSEASPEAVDGSGCFAAKPERDPKLIATVTISDTLLRLFRRARGLF